VPAERGEEQLQEVFEADPSVAPDRKDEVGVIIFCVAPGKKRGASRVL
jgi:hypothetical protein